MKQEEILWRNILLRANGREVIPRAEIEDMLQDYPKDIWGILFNEAAVGYADGELVVDVSRETLYPTPIQVEDFWKKIKKRLVLNY